MKRYILPALIAMAFVSFDASAQSPCSGNTRVNDLRTLLPGKTVCATRGTDRWQEEHRGSGLSGELWDYKMGPTDKIDPSKKVGTWSIGGPANRLVTYTYGTTDVSRFEVHQVGGKYNFCGTGGANVLGATIQTSPKCP